MYRAGEGGRAAHPHATKSKGGSFSMSLREALLGTFRGSSGVHTLAVRMMFCSLSCFSSVHDSEWPASGGRP